MLKTLKKIDIFGAPIPTLNLRGERSVNTAVGSMVSILVFTTTLLFGLLKLQHLIERKNPTIMVVNSPLNANETFDTGSNDFMMAFAVSDFNELSDKALSNPRYVRWLARFGRTGVFDDNSTVFHRNVTLH